MGTPREYFLGQNQEAIGILKYCMENLQEHLTPLEEAENMVSAMHSEGLIVVNREEWEIASALIAAVRAAGPRT